MFDINKFVEFLHILFETIILSMWILFLGSWTEKAFEAS